MATTTVSSKGQIVIPRALREKYRLTTGTRLEVAESAEGLVLAPLKEARTSRRHAGWRVLRGSARGTNALKDHLAEHRREAKR
jgi:AbrB family looped-hinge helix DNA binding protein